jgi:hypothetical protein
MPLPYLSGDRLRDAASLLEVTAAICWKAAIVAGDGFMPPDPVADIGVQGQSV